MSGKQGCRQVLVANELRQRKIPPLAWVLGCLGLLVFCAVIFALGAAGLAIYGFASSQGDARPALQAEVTIVAAPEEGKAATVGPAITLAPEASATPEARETTSSAPEPNPAASASPSPAAPDEIEDPYAADRAAIEDEVVAIRQLEPKEDVAPVSLTPEELRQRLEGDLLEDYTREEARNDAISLSAFDFLPADFDLYSLLLDLLTEQIAGYYDPESDEFVIISDEGDFGPLEQVTYAHEYVHALQDQYYDLEQMDEEELGSEGAFAVQALAEGDATLVQTQFMLSGYLQTEQLLALMEESLAVDTAVLDSAPPVMVHELEFPYLSGLEFVQALLAQGGFDALDAAWRDLPQSTEHILHPQRYLAGDAPQLVSLIPLTDTLGAGWALADEDTLGEFYLREYLGQQLPGGAVDQAATGWGGDRYAVYWNEADQSLVMVLKLVWDTPADADEFAQLYPGYPEGLFGGASAAAVEGGLCWSGSDALCMFASGSETLIVRAPDAATAVGLAAIQQAGS
jgi:hypothetical protein